METMKTRAAVAWGPAQPLTVEEVDLQLPRKGEVLVRIVATGVCHTDAFTLSGKDPEGKFPAILGHEGGGIVEAVGEGVTSVEAATMLFRCIPPNAASANSANLEKRISARQSGHPGTGADARWHDTLFQGWEACLPLHGHFDLLRIYGDP